MNPSGYMFSSDPILNRQSVSQGVSLTISSKIDPIQTSLQQIPHPTQKTRQLFEQLLTCHICFCHVSSPMMCPYCSKLYCQSCIRKCLQFKSECPNCRKNIKNTSSLANCNRFINQLTSIVHQLIHEKSQQEICKEHSIQINYYCQQCQQPICCQCHIFGQHDQHVIKRLENVYRLRYDCLRDMLSQFKTKLKDKQHSMKEKEGELVELKNIRQRNVKELQDYTESYRLKIIHENAKKSQEIQGKIERYNEMLQNLTKLQQDLRIKAEEAERNGTFILQQNFVSKIQGMIKIETQEKEEKKQYNVLDQIIPPYVSWIFKIPDFTKRVHDRGAIEGPIQKFEGSEWRLKLSIDEKVNSEQAFVNIFVEMVSTLYKTTLYDYQIELVNRKNPQQSIIRESSSTFEPNQSWGYNKYIKLEQVFRGGFVDPVNDQLQIRYYIRNPFYHSIYKQKQMYIHHLDQEIVQQQIQIKQLQKLLGVSHL